MKKILFIPLVFIVVLLIDVLWRCITIYSHSCEHENGHYSMYYTKQPAEVVVVGASRALHNYDCSMIQDSLGLQTLNLGADGMGIGQQYLSFLRILENGCLKMCIYDLAPAQLQKPLAFNGKDIAFTPFYWENDSVKALLDYVYSPFRNLRYLSALVQYNNTYVPVLTAIARRNSEPLLVNNGTELLPYIGEPFMDEIEDDITEFIPDEKALNIFNRMVGLCKSNNIRLVLVTSPILYKTPRFNKWLENFSTKEGVEYYDYSGYTEVVEDRTLFKDKDHINSKGAELFTQDFITKLQ